MRNISPFLVCFISTALSCKGAESSGPAGASNGIGTAGFAGSPNVSAGAGGAADAAGGAGRGGGGAGAAGTAGAAAGAPANPCESDQKLCKGKCVSPTDKSCGRKLSFGPLVELGDADGDLNPPGCAARIGGTCSVITGRKGKWARVQFVNGSLQFDPWQRSVSQRSVDVDGDGMSDFLAINAAEAEYSYLHQENAGDFVDKAWYGNLGVGDTRATFLRRKKGSLPILAGVTVAPGPDAVGVLLLTAVARPSVGMSKVDGWLELPVQGDLGRVLAWDHDGDGLEDVVVGGLKDVPGATLIRVDDQGQLTKAASFPDWPGVVSDARVADVDEDGVPDVVTSFVPTDAVGSWPGEIMRTRWLRSTATGIALTSFDAKGQLLGVADFDDDGHVDVAVLRSVGSNYKQWVDVYRGDGAGGLALALTVEVRLEVGTASVPWVPNFICDYNGDGLPDLGTYFQSNYAFFLNTSE